MDRGEMIYNFSWSCVLIPIHPRLCVKFWSWGGTRKEVGNYFNCIAYEISVKSISGLCLTSRVWGILLRIPGDMIGWWLKDRTPFRTCGDHLMMVPWSQSRILTWVWEHQVEERRELPARYLGCQRVLDWDCAEPLPSLARPSQWSGLPGLCCLGHILHRTSLTLGEHRITRGKALHCTLQNSQRSSSASLIQ